MTPGSREWVDQLVGMCLCDELGQCQSCFARSKIVETLRELADSLHDRLEGTEIASCCIAFEFLRNVADNAEGGGDGEGA